MREGVNWSRWATGVLASTWSGGPPAAFATAWSTGIPLLDRRVLELALSLPTEQYRRGPSSRWLMRHALALDAVLPPEVCWHESKSDPARFNAASDAFLGALPSIRRELAARAVPPGRARYVDMPRLVERLEDPALSRSRKRRSWPGLAVALSFLDF